MSETDLTQEVMSETDLKQEVMSETDLTQEVMSETMGSFLFMATMYIFLRNFYHFQSKAKKPTF